MKRPAKVGLALALVGSVFPVVYLVLYHFGAVRVFPDWGSYLWPTAIQLMLTDGHEDDLLWVSEVVGISVGLNALMWFLVGVIVVLVLEKWARGRRA